VMPIQHFRTQSSAARAQPSLLRQANGERIEGTTYPQTLQIGGGARPHAEPKEGIYDEKLIVILLIGCAFVISQGFRNVAAADEGLRDPCSQTGWHVCRNGARILFPVFCEHSPFSLAKCGSEGVSGVTITALAIGAYTSDANGACVTWTETDTDSPESAAPPTVFVVHQTAKATNYDPTTGTGDGVFANYFGGTCHGSTFDSTGRRSSPLAPTTSWPPITAAIDSVVTSLTNSVGAFGGFSISGTALRQ